MLSPPLGGGGASEHEEEEAHVWEPRRNAGDGLHKGVQEKVDDGAHESTSKDDGSVFRASCSPCDHEAEYHARDDAPRTKLVALHVDFASSGGKQVVSSVCAYDGHVDERARCNENSQKAVAEQHAQHAAGAEHRCHGELGGGGQVYARKQLGLYGI